MKHHFPRKMSLAALSGAALALACVMPTAGAAEIWSEPTYTEQWSQPTYTEQWSQPTFTDLWSQPADPQPQSQPQQPQQPRLQQPQHQPSQQPQLQQQPLRQQPASSQTQPTPVPQTARPVAPKQPAVYVKLQLNSLRATIQIEEKLLDVAPIRMNGRTMVPFRFLGEVLNAEVDWDPANQIITFIQGNRTILLKIGETAALVNGSPVQMDAPPTIEQGRTLVPLRFIAENMNLQVQYTDATQTIEISDQPIGTQNGSGTTGSGQTAAGPWYENISQSSTGTPTAPSASNTPSASSSSSTPSASDTPSLSSAPSSSASNPLLDFEALYGDWLIWTPGGATNLYFKDTGNYATHEYTPGAEQGTISIRKDGTFTMKYGIWGDAEGKWRLSYPREINGEIVQGIILENGSGGYTWAVAPSDNGTIRLLSEAGRWADGSAMWLIDSELHRKP